MAASGLRRVSSVHVRFRKAWLGQSEHGVHIVLQWRGDVIQRLRRVSGIDAEVCQRGAAAATTDNCTLGVCVCGAVGPGSRLVTANHLPVRCRVIPWRCEEHRLRRRLRRVHERVHMRSLQWCCQSGRAVRVAGECGGPGNRALLHVAICLSSGTAYALDTERRARVVLSAQPRGVPVLRGSVLFDWSYGTVAVNANTDGMWFGVCGGDERNSPAYTRQTTHVGVSQMASSSSARAC